MPNKISSDDQFTVTTAVNLANTTAQRASDLAATAVRTATDLETSTSATTQKMTETIAVINTNFEWMKTSQVRIESTLEKMTENLVSNADFQEEVKRGNDREARLRIVESNQLKGLGFSAAIGAILGYLIPYLLKQVG